MSNSRRAAEIAAAIREDGHIEPTGFERCQQQSALNLKSRTTAQPGSCFGKGVQLGGRQHEIAQKDYIICTWPSPVTLWPFYEKYRQQPAGNAMSWIACMMRCWKSLRLWLRYWQEGRAGDKAVKSVDSNVVLR